MAPHTAVYLFLAGVDGQLYQMTLSQKGDWQKLHMLDDITQASCITSVGQSYLAVAGIKQQQKHTAPQSLKCMKHTGHNHSPPTHMIDLYTVLGVCLPVCSRMRRKCFYYTFLLPEKKLCIV